MESGWKWKKRFIKPTSDEAYLQSQYTYHDKGEVHVKWAAVPGWKTRVCLTCSWIFLSLRKKQVHSGLWFRLSWFNRFGNRGKLGNDYQEEGDISGLEKTGHFWLADLWEMTRSYAPGWFPFATCLLFEYFNSQHCCYNSVPIPQYQETI